MVLVALSRAVGSCTGSLLRLMSCAVDLDLACARAKVGASRHFLFLIPV